MHTSSHTDHISGEDTTLLPALLIDTFVLPLLQSFSNFFLSAVRRLKRPVMWLLEQNKKSNSLIQCLIIMLASTKKQAKCPRLLKVWRCSGQRCPSNSVCRNLNNNIYIMKGSGVSSRENEAPTRSVRRKECQSTQPAPVRTSCRGRQTASWSWVVPRKSLRISPGPLLTIRLHEPQYCSQPSQIPHVHSPLGSLQSGLSSRAT